MLKGAYNNLRTMVALPDAGTRRQLRKALQYEGLHHCREAPELPALAGKLADGDVDLLITTIDEEVMILPSLAEAIRVSLTR